MIHTIVGTHVGRSEFVRIHKLTQSLNSQNQENPFQKLKQADLRFPGKPIYPTCQALNQWETLSQKQGGQHLRNTHTLNIQHTSLTSDQKAISFF